MIDADHRRRAFDWRWLGRSVFLRRRQAIILLAMTAAVYAVGLVFPISVQKAVDLIVTGHAGAVLIGLAVAVLAATAVEAMLMRARQTLIIGLAAFIDRRIARIIFAHLMRARIDGTRFQSGETINRFTQARKIQTFVLNDVPRSLFDGGSLVVSLIAMVVYDPFVGIAVATIAPAVLLFTQAPLRESRSAAETYFKTMGRQQNVLSETVNAIATVKSLGLESVRMALWSRATDVLLGSLRHVMQVQRKYAMAAQVAGRLLTLVVLSIGCLRLIQGRISVGDLLALQMLAGRITGPLLQATDVYGRYQEVDVAIRQIETFLSSPREAASIRPPIRQLGAGGIVLHDVSLTYPGSGRRALNGVSLRLPDRGVIAVVGRNGSGKSTLIRILLGLNRSYEGRIEFAGHDLRHYDPRWLRGQIGVVDQDTVLFSGTVRANLVGPKPANEAVLRAALAFAGATDLVNALPGGLDAELTENGMTLSGGERQRLSIARAIIRNPTVAFFDEPAAFLDAEAAVALEQRLTSWGRNRLLLLVSHHLSATRAADLILVMDRGILVGQGRHEELLESEPIYASLWADYTRGLEVL